ncbi:hypothetical protein ACFSQQ_09065 [Mesorhizobium kowhaii]|uniref:hypothetical protein n=1 Tax=Mesorhizobium kowhaii TaxID=1300272 RepID=UPI003631FFA4
MALFPCSRASLKIICFAFASGDCRDLDSDVGFNRRAAIGQDLLCHVDRSFAARRTGEGRGPVDNADFVGRPGDATEKDGNGQSKRLRKRFD